MQRVLETIEQRKGDVARHPLFEWMNRDDVRGADRFVFAPVFVNFIMAFRDMNRWFMRYSSPQNRYQKAINRHTKEDATHSRLFLEDWGKLGLDERLGWRASDAIWWCYAAEETEIFREFGMEILHMATLYDEPAVRFGFMEAIEACGHVFFTHTAVAAAKLERETGQTYRYFGDFHLQRELGHLIGADGLFDVMVLDGRRRRLACALANRIFDMFLIECDHLLTYAERALSGEPSPAPWTSIRTLASVSSPGGIDVQRLSEAAAQPDDPARPDVDHHPSQLDALRVLEQRKQQCARHPLFAWMQADDGVAPEVRLRRFVALWVPDIMGYRDLSRYALSYRWARYAPERAINRWTERLTTHHHLFMRDWMALGMDELLGWSARDTIQFYLLGMQSELQRRSMSAFVKLAFQHSEPLLRYWLIRALEASGHAFFANTSRLARQVEARLGCRLDYLGDRHGLAHPALDPDPDADAVVFARERLDEAGNTIVQSMIHTVFDRLEEQYSLSLELAERDFFGAQSAGRRGRPRAQTAT